MRLDTEHYVPAEPKTWWDLMEDPGFLAASDNNSGILRETLCNDVGAGKDGRRLLHVRWTSQRELPGVVKKVLKADRLSYELIQHMDDERLHMLWEVVPPISKDRFHGAGEFWIEPAPGGCVRKVTGKIEVRIPIVGGRIEKMLAAEISKGHAANAKTATDWLKREPQSR
jgi:hypothetical protein